MCWCGDGDWRQPRSDLFAYRILFGRSDRGAGGSGELDGEETYTVLWWENLKERDHLEDIDVDGRSEDGERTEKRTVTEIS